MGEASPISAVSTMWINCLAQGHNLPPTRMRLEPETPRSQVLCSSDRANGLHGQLINIKENIDQRNLYID